MRRLLVASALAATSACFGCGNREHPAFLPMNRDEGTGGARDAGATGGRSAGHSGGASGKGSGGAGNDGSGGAPVDVPSWGLLDGFDQTKVYLLGTIEETPMCNHYAVSLVSDGNQYAPAFPCLLPNRYTINNGKLYYELSDGHEIHEFVPDYSDMYTNNPYSNDRKVDIPCTSLITGYVINPSGHLIYHCISIGWFDAGGTPIYDGTDTFVAYTDKGTVATLDGVMSLKEQVLHPVPALANTYGVRVHEEEFHYAIQPDPMKQPELWSVDAAGTATKLGDYPAPPDGVKNVSLTSPLLAPDDSLYGAGSVSTNNKLEVIFRRTIDGTSEVVYTEADQPIVKMGGGTPMITGP
jgi:hypothetical protein